MSQMNELEIMERIALEFLAVRKLTGKNSGSYMSKSLLHHLLIPMQRTSMH